MSGLYLDVVEPELHPSVLAVRQTLADYVPMTRRKLAALKRGLRLG